MPADALPTFHLAGDAAAVDAELLVVPVFEGPRPSDAVEVVDAVADALGRAVAAREVTGAPFEQWWAPVHTGLRASRVVGLGAGPRDRWSPDVARRLASSGRAAGASAPHHAISRWSCRHRTTARLRDWCRRSRKARSLAQHDTGHLKSAPPELPHARRVSLVVRGAGTADLAALEPAVRRGRVLAECTNLARALGNEPSNVLTPRELARRAEAAAEGTTLSVTVLDEQRDPRARHGVAARRRAGQRRAAARDHPRAQPAGRTGVAGARAWWAKASRSTPAASRSSPPTAWSG